jgi:biotin synthase
VNKSLVNEIKEKYFSQKDLYELLFFANSLRKKYKGNKVELCAIINAKSGKCPGDCIFCAQSSRYKTRIKIYPLLEAEEVVKHAKNAKSHKVKRFSIVTSGIKPSQKELKKIAKIVEETSKTGVNVCASLGILKEEEIAYLRDHGLSRLHCNLETSEDFFPKVCTTHSYHDKLKTLENAKKIGVSICSGGIFGIGENWEDRIKLALKLKEIEVDSIPLNFLIPIKGTPLENQPPLSPFEALRIIAIFRIILPEKDIRIAGGRLQVLKDFSSWIFLAGANALMTGNYLTTKGNPFENDLRFIKNHELEIVE